jgi:hypothetical protein
MKTHILKIRWYNEECKTPIEEIKKAREKWLIKGIRENDEQKYHHKRTEAHKIIRSKKNLYIKNVIESTEEDNNTRKKYQTINQFKKGFQHKLNVIKNKKGELAMNIEERQKYGKNILINY